MSSNRIDYSIRFHKPGQPAMVGPASHLAVGILAPGRRPGDRPAVRLPFGGQLAQAVEVSLDLVDDVPVGAGIIWGEEIRVALRVVRGDKTADRFIHPAAQGTDCIGRLPVTSSESLHDLLPVCPPLQKA